MYVTVYLYYHAVTDTPFVNGMCITPSVCGRRPQHSRYATITLVAWSSAFEGSIPPDPVTHTAHDKDTITHVLGLFCSIIHPECTRCRWCMVTTCHALHVVAVPRSRQWLPSRALPVRRSTDSRTYTYYLSPPRRRPSIDHSLSRRRRCRSARACILASVRRNLARSRVTFWPPR